MLRHSHDGVVRPSGSGGLPKRQELGPGPVPATRRPVEELLTAMRKGAELLKHGRQGKPKLHFFRLADGDCSLTWRSAKGSQRSVPLRAVSQVVAGQTTESFRRHPIPAFARRSLSLLYTDREAGQRTLDLTAPDAQTFELWFWGLQAITDRLCGRQELRGEGPAPAQLASPAFGALGLPVGGSHQLEQEQQQQPAAAAKLSPRGVGGGTAQGRASGAVGVPVPEPALGDCYCWGSECAAETGLLGPRQQRGGRALLPERVPDTQHLDIVEVAVGGCHAALLTRGGEVYAWGDGRGGKLGLGHLGAAPAPQRVHTLWGQPVRRLACSDASTAAIGSDGRLLAWGEAALCGSGQAERCAQHIPRPVAPPLSEALVVQVACGPFHCAAVTADGRLFTWGGGMGGRLGHGDCCAAATPRQVAALADQAVTRAACGTWHTAAVASPRPGEAGGLARLPLPERQSLQRTLAAAYELTEQDGGSLFTWGCAFGSEAAAAAPAAPAAAAAAAAASHRGCLGLGDRAGRLLPTRVGGALEGLAVTAVAAGAGFTAAATADGRAWQMGETVGGGGKAPPWEGALSPCQVGGALAEHAVLSLAAGAHHAAALARPRRAPEDPAGSGSGSSGSGSVLLTWGRGREGQLGTGAATDCPTPQPVTALVGRRLLQVSCGAFRTMAVCLHDPGAEEPADSRKGYKAKMRHWLGAAAAAQPAAGGSGAFGPSPLASPAPQRSSRPERERESRLARAASGLSAGGGVKAKRLASSSLAEAPGGGAGAGARASDGGEEGLTRESSEAASLRSDASLTAQAQLEARIQQLQALLRQQQQQQQEQPQPQQPAQEQPPQQLPLPPLALPSSRGSTLLRGGSREVSRLSLAECASGSPREAGSATQRRQQQQQQQQQQPPLPSPPLTSRSQPLPNARQSALFQTIQDVSAAAAADAGAEAAALQRLRAQLTAQLAAVEQRQAALAAAGQPQEAEAPTPAAGTPRSREPGPLAATRLRAHRRSRSGSNSSALSASYSRAAAATPAAERPPPAAVEAGGARCEEVAPGVFLTVEAEAGGSARLSRIRFARSRFTKPAADAWWRAHRHELARRFARADWLQQQQLPPQAGAGDWEPAATLEASAEPSPQLARLRPAHRSPEQLPQRGSVTVSGSTPTGGGETGRLRSSLGRRRSLSLDSA